jgi:type I restriction-modification system DNA methylase subunit
LGWAPRSEFDVEGKVASVLERFVGQKFNGVTITLVKRQYEVEGRRADIAVLKDDGKPLLIIETKKKERGGSWSVERHFILTTEDVVGQAASYAALLKRIGVYVPFIATANDRQLALFRVPENIEDLVDWDAIDERDYGRVVKDFYKFKKENLILHRPHGPFSEEFFKELLDTITGIYVAKYSVGEKRQDWHWLVLEDLRAFVDFLAPFIEQAIAEKGRFKDSIAGKLEEYRKKTGYKPAPPQLAREMAYVLLNKIVFYKVLEHYYKLPRLAPLYREGVVKTCSEYLKKLREYFAKAVEATRDFQAVFETGIYDEVDLVENEGVLEAIDGLIGLIESYRIERLGDVVGFIYEDLIPGEERHQLGQFYTPKPIAELIVKWCVRSPDDKVLDPGCGSGTFLVETYKRLAELKLKKLYCQIKHVPEDVHKQILSQLYGIDVNEFPAHLTAMNLAMKNVRVPSPTLNIFVRDYFTIRPGFKTLAPYKVKTPEGEKQVEVMFKDFDAVVGNPPYTRWGELSRVVQNHIATSISNILERYDLMPQAGRRGAEYNTVVFWITHSIGFLKEGGILGMIVSDSWLQTAYGVRFGRLLADHFKIHAIIDISARVFPVPLIGPCIVLLERYSNEEERDNNNVAFVYLHVKKSGINVSQVLKLVEEKKPVSISSDDYDIIVRVYKQSEVRGSNEPWIRFLFGVDDVMNQLRALEEKLLVRLERLFEPTYGNILYTVLYTRRVVRTRHAGVGGEAFFYLTDEDVRRHDIPQEFFVPLISSSGHMPFFTFTKEDWERIKRKGAECWLFLCHRPRNELPPQVQRYIQLGETEIVLAKGIHKGEPVSRSRAAEERRRLRRFFFDWYDLEGVVEAPIYVTYGARYWIRFVLAKFQSALDHRVLALITRQGVQFDEVELKALLAYLNSTFTQIQAEVMGRTAGGVAILELDAKPLSSFLVLDVKKLPRGDVEKLARLFDRLEAEARRLGGADVIENVFGSELAEELTGRSNVKPGVEGLFNTVIREIDHEVARVLGLENLVEPVRAVVLEMARRRLSRGGEAKREAVKGTEELLELRKPRRRGGAGGGGVMYRRLDEFMKKSGGEGGE